MAIEKELPEGWEWKELGDVAVVTSGSPAPQKEKHFQNGTYPFLRTSDLATYGKTDKLERVRDHINDECLMDCRLKKIEKGTVVFPKSGASILTNNRAILGTDGYFVSHLCSVNSGDLITNKYVYYLLQTIDMADLCENPSYPSLKISNVRKILIPVPPIEEQKRIVGKLNSWFEVIQETKIRLERELQNTKDLFQSQLNKVFINKDKNWLEIKLGEVCNLITDGKHGDCKNEDDSGYYFLSVKDVKNDTLNYEDARQITKEDFEETHRRTNLEPGDVLVTNTGTIGRMAIAPNDEKTYKTTFQKSVAIIKPKRELIDNNYCRYHLMADLDKLVNVSEGTAQKNLLLRDLRNHTVLIPSLSKQAKIVHKLDEISTRTKLLELNYQQGLNTLETLRISVLDYAFKGKL